MQLFELQKNAAEVKLSHSLLRIQIYSYFENISPLY